MTLQSILSFYNSILKNSPNNGRLQYFNIAALLVTSYLCRRTLRPQRALQGNRGYV